MPEPDKVEFPNRIPGVTTGLDHYLPEARENLESYGAAQFLDGLREGLAVMEKLINWLTSKPPIDPWLLREYVMQEHDQIVKRHWHLTTRVKIAPALRALMPQLPTVPPPVREMPCCHEWYQGACIHCERTVKEVRAQQTKPNNVTTSSK